MIAAINLKSENAPSKLEFEAMQTLVRNKSLTALSAMIENSGIELLPVENTDDYLYGEFMSYILIFGDALKLTLKAHYNRIEVENYLTKKIEGVKPSQQGLADFMREFCNMASGHIIEVLNLNHVAVNSSLPFVTRGFDEVFFSDSLESHEICDWWKLSLDGLGFVCSSNLVVYDSAKIVAIDPKLYSDNGGITIL